MAGGARIIRAMLGTGLTFAAGVGAVAALVAGLAALAGQGTLHELFGMAGRFAVVAFLLGVAFSGTLALSARRRRFAELSIARFAALGAGAGLLYFAFLAVNAAGRWSLADAVANLVILTLMGTVAAAGTFLLARRGRAALPPGAEARVLTEGDRPGEPVYGGRRETRGNPARQ